MNMTMPSSPFYRPGLILLTALLIASQVWAEAPPPRMSGIGNAHLKISTSSELAQIYFDQGLNLLHCFWDHEAYRAFSEAIRLDPAAPMPYWGLYMSLNYNQSEQRDERQRALAQMRRLIDAATDREQRYLRAVLRLNEAPGAAGQAAFIDEMEKLIVAHPGEVEAKLFLSKFLFTESGGYFTDPDDARGRDRQSAVQRAQDILAALLESHPDHHAVHHYWIHVHEYGPTPEVALDSARKLPTLAPSSGHILHMPGHIYFQLGRYEQAYRSFHAGLAFDQAYMKARDLAPADNWNYVHNLDYLVANCAEDGRYAEGQRWGQRLLELPVAEHRHHSVGQGFVVYGGRSALARLHMRYGNWPAAAAALQQVLESGDLPPGGLPARYLASLGVFAHGMAVISAGDLEGGAQVVQQLLRLSLDLREAEAEHGMDWYFSAAQRIVAIAALELNGNLLSAQGRHDDALRQLERAVEMEEALGYWEPPHYARPVYQSLAQAYARAGRLADARRAFERELERRPENGHALFGIARAHAAAGDIAAARRAYERFLEAWSHADRDLPTVQVAQSWLAAHR